MPAPFNLRTIRMHKLLPLALLFATAAHALQPADVQITTDPAVTLKIERRLGNTSKLIQITVNKQDRVTQIKLGAPAPAPAPAPVPAPSPPAPAPPPVALPTAGYTACASEGATCAITQPSNVIYGSGTKYTAPKPFVADVACNNATFGDPTPGAVKSCWTQPTGAPTDTSGSDMSTTGPVVDAA